MQVTPQPAPGLSSDRSYAPVRRQAQGASWRPAMGSEALHHISQHFHQSGFVCKVKRTRYQLCFLRRPIQLLNAGQLHNCKGHKHAAALILIHVDTLNHTYLLCHQAIPWLLQACPVIVFGSLFPGLAGMRPTSRTCCCQLCILSLSF